MSESNFVKAEHWTHINRGYFYQAAMYYLSDTKQPLRFVEASDDGKFNVVKRYGDFRAVKIKTNERYRAIE